jgi:hypothetical protein
MKVILGCLLGIAIGAAICYGIVEFGDWIVEQTHYELSSPR